MSLLPAADIDPDGRPLLAKETVEKYRVLTEWLGGTRIKNRKGGCYSYRHFGVFYSSSNARAIVLNP